MIAAPVGEARGAQHLHRQVDRAHRRPAAPRPAIELLERAPVRRTPSRCSRCRPTRRGRRPRRRAGAAGPRRSRPRGGSARRTPSSSAKRRRASSARPGGRAGGPRRSRRRPSRPSRAGATMRYRPSTIVSGVRLGHSSASSSIICLAIGAATSPPKPDRRPSTVTATATCGSSAGAKAMNQRLFFWFGAGRRLRRAGLAGDLHAGDLRLRAGAALDHARHHLRSTRPRSPASSPSACTCGVDRAWSCARPRRRCGRRCAAA